jgi:signal transduction histidine kinase
VGGDDFIVAIMQDISAEKRRDVLERAFFHEALNTLNALSGWSSVFERLDGEKSVNAVQQIGVLSRRLTRAIQDQRTLRKAERGELEVTLDRTVPSWVMEQARRALIEAAGTDRKRVDIEPPAGDDHIETDPALLVRVLELMLRNALEWGHHQVEPVRLSYRVDDGVPEFAVWNAGHIPPEVAKQIFKRSYSSRSEPGRGLGTYSMKLYGEQFLDGQVGFNTSPEAGTLFFIRLGGGS